jgi:hypothetical protein
MLNLLHKPYAYPEEKLTRGDVARIICNYLDIVPMHNEQIFLDVKLDNTNSPYIRAVNKLGIMGGIGNNTFAPDRELSLQEFAVIAQRIILYGKAEAMKTAENWRDTNPFMDQYTLKEIADIDAGYKKRVEEGFNPPTNSTPKVFADNNQIASWAKPAIDELSRWGILEGDGGANPYLHPTETLSKTRFFVFMYKFNEKLKLMDYSINNYVPLF